MNSNPGVPFSSQSSYKGGQKLDWRNEKEIRRKGMRKSEGSKGTSGNIISATAKGTYNQGKSIPSLRRSRCLKISESWTRRKSKISWVKGWFAQARARGPARHSMLIISKRAKVGNQLQITERGSPMDQVPGTQPPNANPKDFGSKNLKSVWFFFVQNLSRLFRNASRCVEVDTSRNVPNKEVRFKDQDIVYISYSEKVKGRP